MRFKSLIVFALAVVFVLSANAEVLSATSGEHTWLDFPAVTHYNSAPLVVNPLADLIDQNQPSGPAYMAGFSQGGLAQSFQQTNTNISGAGICLQPGIGSSDNVTIQVWDDIPDSGTPTMLAEASATGTAGEWVDVFWTAVDVTPGTTYYLVFTGNTTLGITGDLDNPYPYGNVFANSGYTPYPSFDYAFRTYWDDNVSLERSTWAGVKTMFN